MDLLVSRRNHEETGTDTLKPRNNERTSHKTIWFILCPQTTGATQQTPSYRRLKQAGLHKPQLKSLAQHHRICHDKKPQPSALAAVWWQEVTRSGRQAVLQKVHRLSQKSQSFCRRYSQLLTTSDSVCSESQKSVSFTQQFLVAAKVFSHTMVVIINSFQKQNSTWRVKMSYLLCKSLSYKLRFKVHYWQR